MVEKKRVAAGEGERRVYYVVNPGGAIHDCSREVAAECLKHTGYRLATAAEIEELKRRNGHQSADNPICAPSNPEPDGGKGEK